jgi:hypothetical protein
MRYEVRGRAPSTLYVPWHQGGDGTILKPEPQSLDHGSDLEAAKKHAADLTRMDYRGTCRCG